MSSPRPFTFGICAAVFAAVLAAGGVGCVGPGPADRFCNSDRDCRNGDACLGGACTEAVRLPRVTADDGSGGSASPNEGEGEGEGEAAPLDPEVDPCRAVVDGFDDGVIAPEVWFHLEEGASLVESEGEVLVDLPTTTGTASAALAAPALRLEGRSITVDVAQIAVNEGAVTYVAIAGASRDVQAYMAISATRSLVSAVIGGVEPDYAETGFDSVADRFLRIRETAGTLAFEASPDDVAYVELLSAPTPAFGGDVDMFVGAQAEATTSGSISAFGAVISPRPELCSQL